MEKHILGYPRVGVRRELKTELEAFWKGAVSLEQLRKCGSTLRHNHWRIQRDAGLSRVAVGDFSFYDHVLDTSLMLGAIPARFRHLPPDAMETYFTMARGDKAAGIPAMEMTKWFNSNYHYIVPEIGEDFEPRLLSRKLVDETTEALAAGFKAKPVLVGPFTYI